MAKGIPTRVDEDVFTLAQALAPLASRSAAQQVSHWARIGQAVEAGRSVSHRAIADVLAHRANYDDLNSEEQAIVRVEWAGRMDELRSSLDLAAEFTSEGRSSVELGDDGEVVRHPARATDPDVE